MKQLRVLSLFDGMSCGQIALRELGIPISAYYASEIDKFAIKQTQLNFPDTIQIGDVRFVDVDKLCEDGEIDLLIGGSPCTDLSFAGRRNGLSTTTKEEIHTLDRYMELKEQGFQFEGQSYLFWEYMRILSKLRERNPNILFLLENVKMEKKWEHVFSDAIGCEGVHINSALVSAQNRRRIYWTNIGRIEQPDDRCILLCDILESEVDEKYYLKNEVVRNLLIHKERNKKAGNGFGAVFHDTDGKMGAVRVKGSHKDDLVKVPDYVAMRGRNPDNANNLTDTNGKAKSFLDTSGKGALANGMSLVSSGFRIRRLTPTECARLQTIPDWYKWDCSNTQQYRMLGNGWTVEVIKHIFSYLIK